jgi:hypothetical protein
MSKFFTSFTKNTHKTKNKMKLHYSSFTNKWTFHIIPTIHLFFDSHSPFEHKRFLKDGLAGLYLSFQWGKWLFTIGLHKEQ